MSSSKVRVAIVGVGNCASSLVQGLHYYSHDKRDALPVIGPYGVDDIEVVAAFDVNYLKVGRDLSHAIFQMPNCTMTFSTPPPSGVIVQRGPTLDGIGKYLSETVPLSDDAPVDVARTLRESGANVLVNYLPVGSEVATMFYAEEAIRAGCAMVNCIPVFIASRPDRAKLFRDARLPIIGDDIKSQVGATIVHRVLAQLMHDRGVQLRRTSQLNVGGNTDFLNMLERERLESKKISKTEAVTSVMGIELPARDVHVGPSDYVPWLEDRKWCHLRLEGEGFGGAPITIELKLEVHDSPNSAGIVIDAVRCAKLALDRGMAGAVTAPSAWFMKHPPRQFEDDKARQNYINWLLHGGDF